MSRDATTLSVFKTLLQGYIPVAIKLAIYVKQGDLYQTLNVSILLKLFIKDHIPPRSRPNTNLMLTTLPYQTIIVFHQVAVQNTICTV